MKHKISNLGVYITNVCNLNCDNCFYLNNYAFAGHQRWQDYEAEYQRWAQRIDCDLIGMLGGEPMSNPDFLLWVHGIARLWPNSLLRINTNGTMFDRWPQLYDELLPYGGRVWFDVSGHNDADRDSQIKFIQRFLRGKVVPCQKIEYFDTKTWQQSYNNIRDPSWPNCTNAEQFADLPLSIQKECKEVFGLQLDLFVRQVENYDNTVVYQDSNGMRIAWSDRMDFTPAAVRLDLESGRLRLYDSDPEQAVSQCSFKFCHTLTRGKLYKCPLMATLPEFSQQFDLDNTTAQRELISSYVPAEGDWNDVSLGQFMKHLNSGDAIPQCTFCPVERPVTRIQASTKKIKIKKIAASAAAGPFS